MEIYILDRAFNTLDMIENFSSFIWTDRYSAYGDVVLKLPESERAFNRIRPGYYVHIHDSPYLMIVETALREKSPEGDNLITVTGRSFESFFEQRVLTPNELGEDDQSWEQHGSVGRLCRILVERICIDGDDRSRHDIIPNLKTALSDVSESIHAAFKNSTLYEAVKYLCDYDKLGFRVHYDPSDQSLEFRAYRGTDRTRDSDRAVVAFGTDLENLANPTHIRSNLDFKNTAYVLHANRTSGPRVVNLPGQGAAYNMYRRVLLVDANDIEDATTEQLDQRGHEELAAHNYKDVVDGDVDYSRTFRYRRDYFMGDIVEIIGEDGSVAKKRVTEHIWSYDGGGLRSYPTLTSDEEDL